MMILGDYLKDRRAGEEEPSLLSEKGGKLWHL